MIDYKLDYIGRTYSAVMELLVGIIIGTLLGVLFNQISLISGGIFLLSILFLSFVVSLGFKYIYKKEDD